ncbi:hypothetical protein [Lysobacter gummosus]
MPIQAGLSSYDQRADWPHSETEGHPPPSPALKPPTRLRSPP